MEGVELAVEARLLDENSLMDILFELQHLKQISKLSEAMFPPRSQAGYHVNIMCPVAAEFTTVRFPREHSQES